MNQISAPLTDPDLDREARRSAGARRDPKSIEIPLPTRLMRIVNRRRWVIAGAVAGTLILGLIITMLMTPLYTATTQIEISREGNRVTEIQGVEREASTADLEFYQTQYGLLQSESLAESVARNLKLADSATFFRTFGVDPAAIRSGVSITTAGAAARQQRVDAAREILLKHVAISPIRGSRLVDISFTSADPVLSQRVANAWSQNFISSNLARRFEATSYARKFLESRLGQLRQKLEESERQLVAYAQAQNIINLPGSIDRQTGASTGERPLQADELSQLNEELTVATGARITAEAQAQRAQATGSNATALQNTAINALRENRAELAGTYAKLMVQFEPSYPPAKAIQNQIASLDAAIAREENRVGDSFRNAYTAAQAREAALKARVDTLKSGLTDLRGRTIQYNIYQREVDTNRQLYDGLLQRYKEIGVAGGVGTNNIAIVDPAEIPRKPSSPRLAINLLLSLIMGLAIAAAITWLLEQAEEGISDPVDVNRILGAPLLGTVPISESGSVLGDLENPRSPMVEAYLAIQTNLDFSTAHGAPRTISVTSTRPREGKSTTSYALAHSLARARRRVVLIDCDMRSPMVHREFDLANTVGVSNYLAGNDDLTQSLHASPQPGLTIMTAGPIPPNAADLLTGDRFAQLLKTLGTQYDHVVVDSPPVMGLADAPLIASAVEGTVYAVESRVIPASLVKIAMARLDASNANVLGVIMTKFESKFSSYGYGYDYGYGYGRSTAPTE